MTICTIEDGDYAAVFPGGQVSGLPYAQGELTMAAINETLNLYGDQVY